MKLPLPVPAPYDFERSTFRFRMFGDDLASRWQGGGLHRVLRSGLAVRIEADGLTAYGTYTDRAASSNLGTQLIPACNSQHAPHPP